MNKYIDDIKLLAANNKDIDNFLLLTNNYLNKQKNIDDLLQYKNLFSKNAEDELRVFDVLGNKEQAVNAILRSVRRKLSDQKRRQK